METSVAGSTMAAAPMIELSPVTAPAGMPIGEGAGLNVVGPGSGGGDVDPWTGIMGRNSPTEPITVEARKWRRARSGRSPSITFPLIENPRVTGRDNGTLADADALQTGGRSRTALGCSSRSNVNRRQKRGTDSQKSQEKAGRK